MALDDILRTMEEQTAAEEERIRAGARAEAEALLADGQKRAEEAYRREYDNIVAPLRAERMRIVNEARLALQSALQNRKQRLWQEVVEQARVDIQEHRADSGYAKIMTALIDEAAGRLGVSATNGVSVNDVIVEADSAEEVTAEVAVRNSTVAGAKISANGGFEASLGGIALTTADGGVRVVNTLDSRLEEVVNKEVADLATRLFGEG